MPSFPAIRLAFVPIMRLYRLLFSGYDGIILHFRHIFLVFHVATSWVVYKKTSELSERAAPFAAIVYLLYIPFDIPALSYNTTGVMFTTLTGLFLISERREENFFAGIFFAFATLCTPHLVIDFLLFFIIAFFKREYLPRFTFYLFGTLLIFLLFTAYVITTVDIMKMPEAIKYILNEPQHLPRGILLLWKHYTAIFNVPFIHSKLQKWIFFLFAASFVIFLVNTKTKKSAMVNFFLYVVVAINAIILIVFAVRSRNAVNYIIFPINFLGLMAYMLMPNKNKHVFIFMYLFGLLYSGCINIASNNHFWVISMSLMVSTIASCIFTFEYIGKYHWNKKIDFPKLLTYANIFFLLAGMMITKFTYVFEGNDFFNQTVYVSSGPSRGLIVSKDCFDEHEELLKDQVRAASKIKQGDRILFLTHNPISYLNYKNSIGSYSGWGSYYVEGADKRLLDYYKMNPEAWPAFAYIEQDYCAQYEYLFRDAYDKETMSRGCLFTKKN